MVEDFFLSQLVTDEQNNVFFAGFYFGAEHDDNGELVEPAIDMVAAKNLVADKIKAAQGLTAISLDMLQVEGAADKRANGGLVQVKPYECLIVRNHKNKDRETGELIIGKDGKPEVIKVIDWFEPWNTDRTFPKWRNLQQYMNTPEDVATFEAATGFVLADLPLYTGQGGFQRDPQYAEDFEVYLEAPIDIETTTSEYTYTEDGEEKTRTVTRFSRFANTAPVVEAATTS